MKLTGPQREQICNAILAAYDEPNLQRLVEFSLEQRLDQIAGGGNLTDDVSELVRWAERKGYVAELVQAAYERNSKNPALQQLWQDFEEWDRSSAPKAVTDRASAQLSSKDWFWRNTALAALLGLLLIGGFFGYRWLTAERPSTDTPIETPTADTSVEVAPSPENEEQPTPTSGTQSSESAATPPTREPAEPTAPVSTTNSVESNISAENKLGLGDTGEGELFEAETNDWVFDSGPAIIDVILETGPRGQAAIIIFDADGAEIKYADFQIGPEERLINYEIFDDSSYIIAARNLQNEPTQFTLSVTQATPPKVISLNESVAGNIYGDEGIGWIFQGGPATVNIILDVGARGEASISLFDPNGYLITSANSLTGTEERLVNFDILDSEPYTILIRNEANTPANYTLTVEGRSD